MGSEVDARALVEALTQGELTLQGRLVTASNATFLATVAVDGIEVRCVYKPERGERSLWDFPETPLSRREVATYLVSEAGGWGLVPPTVLREAGPFGQGMCQRWIEQPDPPREAVDLVPEGDDLDGRLPVLEAEDQLGRPVTLVHDDDADLRAMAVLDVVVNNADRKGGHVLADESGDLWGCDHGLCFHVEPKLRTVLWGWAGERLRADDVERLSALGEALRHDADLAGRLDELLSIGETEALHARVERLLAAGRMPLPGDGWPAIPWPPF